MNKIFNINLGGYPFVIDDEAYFKLDKYLHTIKKHFSTSEGVDEIVFDIELRIAELFKDNLKGQPIVGLKEIDAVIATMGTPNDFGGSVNDFEESPSGTKEKFKTGKRLYRNPDDKVIAGVCSGIGEYFGIHDPVIVRAIFAVLALSGFSIIAYPILWIIIPEAKTSAEKLSMKGEPINVNNIAKKVEEELNNLSHTITDFAKEFGSNK